MKKRSLIWIAPAIAAALSVAYIRTAPELPGEPVTRPSLTEAESVAQIERTSRRRIVENDDSAAAPEPEATGCTVESLYLPREDGTTVELYTCEPNSPEEHERISAAATAKQYSPGQLPRNRVP